MQDNVFTVKQVATYLKVCETEHNNEQLDSERN